MAELTTMRNDVLGYPIYGLPYVVAFCILDEDGDPVTGLTPDSEISLNGDTGADTATEAAEIAFTTATNKGMYQLQLSAAEMTCNVAAITVYTGATTSQATCIVLYPKQLPLIASGVAGATGDDTTHIHLDGKSAINDFYNGCIVFLKDHTGANQVRMITDYVGATCLATVAPAFATAPDNTTDYEIYLTDVAITTLIANNILQIGGTTQTAGDLAGAIITDAAGANIAADIIAVKAETAELKAAVITNAAGTDIAADIIALKAETVEILTDTAVIGALGAGLTALATAAELAKVPKSDAAVTWNATALASIQTEANDALIANNLDHLALTATGAADMTTEVADNTILARVLGNGDTSTFVPSTDGLHAAGVDIDAILADTNELQVDDYPTSIAAVKADTAAILTDTGTTLEADLDAIIAAVITNAAGVDIAADIIALKAETASILADTNELQVDDYPTSIAAVKADTAAILTDTGTTLDGRIPAALVGGKMDVAHAIPKNTALAKFAFVMTDATTHAPKAGVTVTCTRSIDGAAFGAGTLANVAEQADAVGGYLVDFGAGDLNGKVIMLRATGAGCDDTFVTLVTEV